MTLTEAVEDACRAATWLTPADKAAKKLALTYARRIDEAVESAEGPEVTKALYLGPHLLKALRELGATPAGRGDLGDTEAKEPDGKLGKLRAIPKPKRSA